MTYGIRYKYDDKTSIWSPNKKNEFKNIFSDLDDVQIFDCLKAVG